jgi:hypothetical protein
MRNTNLIMGVCFGFFMLCALSMGNRMYLLIAVLILLAWAFAYASVRMAEKSVKVETDLSSRKVNRGEVVSMEIGVSHKSLLPIAPVALHMRATSNTPAGTIHLTQLGKRKQRVTHKFAADHVGAMFPGVENYTVADVFGFFKRKSAQETQNNETDVKYALLITAADNAEAALIQSILESENIPYLVRDKKGVGVGSVVMGFSMFGYDFFVPENRLDEASALLVPDGVAEEIAEGEENTEEE